MGTRSAPRRGARRVWRAGHGLRVGDLLPRAEKKIPERFGGGRVTSTSALGLRRLGEWLGGSVCHRTAGCECSRCVPHAAVGGRAVPEEAHSDVTCTRSSLYPLQAMSCPARAHGFRRR